MNKTRHLSQALATRRIIRAMNRQLLFLFAGAFLLARTCDAQTFNNGCLIWNNDTNVSLYVILESPNITWPREVWNVIGSVTNVPPSTNAQIEFPIGLTNMHPDYVTGDPMHPWLPEFFCLLSWTNGIPHVWSETNWYALEMIRYNTLDAAGRIVGSYRQGYWFYPTNDIAPTLVPIAQLPGVTNNDPNFNILHF